MVQTFTEGAAVASKQPVVLFEIDVGQLQSFLTNYSAGTWYVNFNKVYPDIDSTFLNGVVTQNITLVGSVAWDGMQLALVGSVAAVEATESTFYFAAPELYVRGPSSNSPAGHSVLFGVSIGMANFDRVFNNQVYEPRVRSVPSLTRSRDPVFFGKVSFDSGQVAIDNTDGEFDDYGELNNVFGGAARLRLGFDDSPFDEFRLVYKGFVENLVIGRDRMEVLVQDQRKTLQRSVGTSTFNTADHPDIDPDNVGKAIPLAYGVVRNIPCVVTNELEGGSPAWTVQLCDPIHDIDAVTAVYVNGTAVTPTDTSLTLATATLANGDFTAGDDVTADITGYEDASTVVIDNALDVILDLITEYFDITFDGNFFDTVAWTAATALVDDVGLFVGDSTPVIDLIEQVSQSVFGSFLVTDDGRFSYSVFVDPGSSGVTLRLRELLDWSPVDYDPSEVLTSTEVGYHRDWDAGTFRRVRDVSQEAALFSVVTIRREGVFETLLTGAADAQSFSDTVLDLQGDVRPVTRVTTKLVAPALDVEVGDFINVELNRKAATIVALGGAVPNDSTGLGFFFCEVLGRTLNLSASELELELRLIKSIADPAPVAVTNEEIYNAGDAAADTFFGDDVFFGGTR